MLEDEYKDLSESLKKIEEKPEESKKKYPQIYDVIKKNVLKRWWLFALAGVFAFALYVRCIPLQNMHHIFDIDVYLFHRLVQDVVANGFHLPAIDVMKYYPTGYSSYGGYFGAFYLPAFFYMIASKLGVSWDAFAKFFPAIMGSLFVVPIYFIGRELHNKFTGLLAGFFYAVSPAVIYRTSVGLLEKEAQAGLFMLCSVWFFIKSIKDDSWLYGILSGLSLFMFSMIWGGVIQLYIGFFLFITLFFLINKYPKAMLKAYIPTVLIGMLLPSLFLLPMAYGTHPMVLMNVFTVALILFKELLERRKVVPENMVKYIAPALYGAGVVCLFISAFFIRKIADIIRYVVEYSSYQKAVFTSTVAENIEMSWGNFQVSFGNSIAGSMFPVFSPLIILTAVWVLATFGILILMYKLYKDKIFEFIISVALTIVMVGSYVKFLQAPSAGLQTAFMISFAVLLFMVARKKWLPALLLILIFIPMLGSMTKSRIAFILAPFLVIFAAYSVTKAVDFLRNNQKIQGIIKTSEQKNIFYVLIALGVGFILVTNAVGGINFAGGIAPGFNDNWEQAMKFLREETPEESVILSWWDFGYWFQTAGQRTTNLDGGNEMWNWNIPTAQYFIGMMNESQQKLYLQKFGTDYIIVDASMVGKFTAMSKIANYGAVVEGYNLFGLGDVYPKDNKTVYVYRSGNVGIWIPVWNENQTIENKILLVEPLGESYVKYICNPDGAYSTDPPIDKPIIDYSVLIGNQYLYLISPRMCESPFTKLYFFNGGSLNYVEKVFENVEVKIFKIKRDIIPRESTEELQAWWDERGGEAYINAVDELIAWKP